MGIAVDIAELLIDLLRLLSVIFTGSFVLLYWALFRPSTTTAGKLILRAMTSLAVWATVALSSGFIHPLPEWWSFVRLAVWIFIAYAFGSMVWLIIYRRFKPENLRTRPIEEDTLEPRHRRKKPLKRRTK